MYLIYILISDDGDIKTLRDNKKTNPSVLNYLRNLIWFENNKNFHIDLNKNAVKVNRTVIPFLYEEQLGLSQ